MANRKLKIELIVDEADLDAALRMISGGDEKQAEFGKQEYFTKDFVLDFNKMPLANRTFHLPGVVAGMLTVQVENQDWDKPKIISMYQ
jgi:hypothetical protein